ENGVQLNPQPTPLPDAASGKCDGHHKNALFPDARVAGVGRERRCTRLHAGNTRGCNESRIWFSRTGGTPPFGFGDAHRSHELDRKTERLSPKTMIGRRMSQDEAKRLMTA